VNSSSPNECAAHKPRPFPSIQQAFRKCFRPFSSSHITIRFYSIWTSFTWCLLCTCSFAGHGMILLTESWGRWSHVKLVCLLSKGTNGRHAVRFGNYLYDHHVWLLAKIGSSHSTMGASVASSLLILREVNSNSKGHQTPMLRRPPQRNWKASVRLIISNLLIFIRHWLPIQCPTNSMKGLNVIIIYGNHVH